MRPFPVDPTTSAAGLEIMLRFKNVGRDFLPYFGGIDGLESLIAPQTPSQYAARWCDGETFCYLPQLIPMIVSSNEKMVAPCLPASDQSCIPCKDDPASSRRYFDEIFIRYFREIFDVTSQKAQPGGQLSEHDICDKLGFRRHCGTSLE